MEGGEKIEDTGGITRLDVMGGLLATAVVSGVAFVCYAGIPVAQRMEGVERRLAEVLAREAQRDARLEAIHLGVTQLVSEASARPAFGTFEGLNTYEGAGAPIPCDLPGDLVDGGEQPGNCGGHASPWLRDLEFESPRGEE